MTKRKFENNYKKETGKFAMSGKKYTNEFIIWLVKQWNKLDKEYSDYVNENQIL